MYTLYQRPGGYPFVHVLDAANRVAHCTGLPFTGNQAALMNVRMWVARNGSSLELDWKSGRHWLTLNTTNWRLTHVHQSGAFPWVWLLAGTGGAVAFVLALGAVLVARHRQPREAVPVAL